jgi:hypothetical protein
VMVISERRTASSPNAAATTCDTDTPSVALTTTLRTYLQTAGSSVRGHVWCVHIVPSLANMGRENNQTTRCYVSAVNGTQCDYHGGHMCNDVNG